MNEKTCKKCGQSYIGERCKPCRRLRMAAHYAENRERLRAKSAAWRSANPDKVRAASAAYRTAKHEQGLAAQAAWRQAHPEKHRAWRYENAARMKELRTAWWAANPEAASVYYARRRAAKKNATPSWVGEFDALVLVEAYRLARQREALTKLPWHVDHVVPLMGRRVCGLHVASNIAVIPAAQNLRKSNKWGVADV